MPIKALRLCAFRLLLLICPKTMSSQMRRRSRSRSRNRARSKSRVRTFRPLLNGQRRKEVSILKSER